MINKKTKNLGPVSAPFRKTPLVTKVIGGNTDGDTPTLGYHLVSSSIIESYTIGDKAAEFSGSGAALGSAYPVIGTNKLPSTGLNPYEPIKLAFIHKFGGPNMATEGLGASSGGSSYFLTEEFLRVKLKKDNANNVYCPYNNAILTATVFPYGQTNRGEVKATGNRTSVSLIRQRFSFVNTRKYSDDDFGPLTQLIPQLSPLNSASINNLYVGSPISNVEFELSTNPAGVSTSYGVGGPSIDLTKTYAISIHPDISSGDLSDYSDVSSGQLKSITSGLEFFPDITNSDIQHVVQGVTDGDDLSFITRAQKGCIIKGIIELF
jgi:hypothetical protein